MFLQLRTNSLQNKAGSRKKPNRLFTLGHFSEKFLDVAVEVLGQTQSFRKPRLWEEHGNRIKRLTQLTIDPRDVMRSV